MFCFGVFREKYQYKTTMNRISIALLLLGTVCVLAAPAGNKEKTEGEAEENGTNAVEETANDGLSDGIEVEVEKEREFSAAGEAEIDYETDVEVGLEDTVAHTVNVVAPSPFRQGVDVGQDSVLQHFRSLPIGADFEADFETDLEVDVEKSNLHTLNIVVKPRSRT